MIDRYISGPWAFEYDNTDEQRAAFWTCGAPFTNMDK